MRAVRSFALVLLLNVKSATCTVDGVLEERATSVLKIANEIERKYEAFLQIEQPPVTSCDNLIVNTCGNSLKTPVCEASYGPTDSCDCLGRKLDSRHAVVKASGEVSTNAEIKQTVCYASGMEEVFTDIQIESENSMKWLYYGSTDGVLINYPGFLWDRDGDGNCSPTYDPRQRPWYLQAATGPKDVLIIVDKSGSMSANGRMGLARDAAIAVINGLTHVDFVAVVAFDSYAYSQNTYMVPATSSYKKSLINWVKSLEPGSRTCYSCAIELAAEIKERSLNEGFTSGCNLVTLFLTDGDPSDDHRTTIDMIQATKRPHDYHMYFSLGDGVDPQILQEMACETGGIYDHVSDNDDVGLRRALTSYYTLLAHVLAKEKVEHVSWSEPYYSIPDIWGPVATAVTPVYDKSAEPWVFLGVAAADIPMCQLVSQANDMIAAGQADAADSIDLPGDTAQGCECVPGSFSYDGKTFDRSNLNDHGCTSYDWSKPWCATTKGCGICDGQVNPSGCWDECHPSDGQGLVELKLRKISDKCTESTIQEDVMEELRKIAARNFPWGGLGACTASDTNGDPPRVVPVNRFGNVNIANLVEGLALDAKTAESLCDNEEYSTSDETCKVCPADMYPSCTAESCTAGMLLKREKEAQGMCSAGNDGGSDGAVLAPIIGIVAGVLVIGGLCYFCKAASARKPDRHSSADPSYPQHQQSYNSHSAYPQQPPAVQMAPMGAPPAFASHAPPPYAAHAAAPPPGHSPVGAPGGAPVAGYPVAGYPAGAPPAEGHRADTTITSTYTTFQYEPPSNASTYEPMRL